MLYDPKWEQQTKADPFSLESLIAWLETRPASLEYQWAIPHHCLIGQWLLCNGVSDSLKRCNQSADLTTNQKTFRHIALGTPHTFGAALERAREIAARR